VVDALYNQEWRQRKAIATHILDHCHLFPIARLKLLALAMSISIRNNYITTNNTYHKACLIEVVEVRVLDCICAHIGYQPEPHAYKVWIFTGGSLEVICA
jgi:hypothetical protein